MVMIAALDRKMLRDLARIWAQALAIALVMACGVMTAVLALGASRSLELTRATFYERSHFGTVFASATRAPLGLESRLSAIPGVSAVALRVVQPVVLDIEGMREPASGLAVSIPGIGEAPVNRLYIRSGRLPQANRSNEVAVAEPFAEAHGFKPGDSFRVIISGQVMTLKITGTVLSPEHIYSIGPGDMVPDRRRYGVLFMPENVLRSLAGLEASFNDLSLTTTRNADLRVVRDAVDRLLEPYGGRKAYEREDQTSNAFLDAELTQLRSMAVVIPPIFLFVSAFLVNMILSRLVALEREQVGLLKALGYSNWAIAAHYAKMVLIISLVGIAIGSVAGLWLGRGLTRLYANFFSFPFLLFEQSLDLYAIGASTAVLAALLGAVKAIASIVRLPPAVAMHPPAPPTYGSYSLGGFDPFSLFSQLTTMALRNMLRRPLRLFLTVLGTSFSVALLVTALFSYDSIDYMIDVVFFQSERQDATLTFSSDLGPDVMPAIRALPGVLRAEPFRVTPVVLRKNNREVKLAITGMEEDAVLGRILDESETPVPPVARGLMLSERVARKLGVVNGEQVDVELSEHNDRVVSVPVTGTVIGYVGLAAYMARPELNRLLRDGEKISGARIDIDPGRLDALYAVIKETPAIATVALQNISRDKFRETIGENIITMTTVYVGLAIIITFGIVYNSARIQLSERARELASLRVLGFTRAEVSKVLLIEIAIVVLLAQPLGWLLGYLFSLAVVKGFESDLFQIPFVINPPTFAWSSIVVVVAGLASAMIVRRRVDHLDLIRVLKTRE